jgi:hypothetical protein
MERKKFVSCTFSVPSKSSGEKLSKVKLTFFPFSMTFLP